MVTAAVRVYDELRSGILDSTFEAGSRLSEDRLARLLGCSRTPVREALRRLSAEGLVELLPNRGAQVVSWSSDDLEDVFRMRALLEGHGAALAAETMDTDEVARLHEIADGMAQLSSDGSQSDRDELATLDVEFHRAVLVGSKSRRLLEAHARVVQVPLHQRVMRSYSPAQLQQRMVHHQELVRAIQLGDADWAASVMRAHILSALNILLEGG